MINKHSQLQRLNTETVRIKGILQCSTTIEKFKEILDIIYSKTQKENESHEHAIQKMLNKLYIKEKYF